MEEKKPFLDLKANLKALVRIVLVFSLLALAWWVFSKATGIGNPKVLVQPKPLVWRENVDISSGRISEFRITIDAGIVPGTLYGGFQVMGGSIGINGAMDDTLVEFYVRGPNNERLNVLDHPTQGNYSIRVTSPGVYNLVFSNAGILRSSTRKVKFEAKYQPD